MAKGSTNIKGLNGSGDESRQEIKSTTIFQSPEPKHKEDNKGIERTQNG
jgi:hypothetical protein